MMAVLASCIALSMYHFELVGNRTIIGYARSVVQERNVTDPWSEFTSMTFRQMPPYSVPITNPGCDPQSGSRPARVISCHSSRCCAADAPLESMKLGGPFPNRSYL